MSKRKRIFYWIATLWLALGMISTGLVQLTGNYAEMKFINALGYPAYFITFLGACKLLGVLAILLPGYVLVKEWAYAGFVFMMTGAIFSHFASGSSLADTLPSVLLLILSVVSYALRPPGRKLILARDAAVSAISIRR